MLQLSPCIAPHLLHEVDQALGMLREKSVIQHWRLAVDFRPVLHLQQGLGDPHDGRGVAADGDLVILGADGRGFRTEHFSGD